MRLPKHLLATGLLFTTATVHALPIVSVDIDPLMPGVQSTLAVSKGDTFSVDVFITDVDAAAPLNAFEFDLLFDSNILAATGITDGGFLPTPIFVVEATVDNSSGLAASTALSLSPDGTSGAGTLTSIDFEAIATGSSPLTLDNVLLSAPFGVAIAVESLIDGGVRVTPAATVSIPTASALLLSGLLTWSLGIRSRKQGRKTRD